MAMLLEGVPMAEEEAGVAIGTCTGIMEYEAAWLIGRWEAYLYGANELAADEAGAEADMA